MTTQRLFWLAIVLAATTATAAEAGWSDLVTSSRNESAAVAPATAARGTAAFTAKKTPRNQAIIGSWMETVTVTTPGGPPPFVSLSSFGGDGTLAVADQGNVTAQQVFSAGHGSWLHVEGRTFAWTVVELVSAPDGSLIGVFEIRGEYTLDAAYDTYTGRFHAEMLAPSGDLIFAAAGTNAGQRIDVRPLP